MWLTAPKGTISVNQTSVTDWQMEYEGIMRSALITVLYYQIHFTMQAEAKRVPPGSSSIDNDAHGVEKLLLKTQVSETFLRSEVNLKYNILQCKIKMDKTTTLITVSKHWTNMILDVLGTRIRNMVQEFDIKGSWMQSPPETTLRDSD